MPNSYCLDIKGDFACFTRPEMKVERVSYDAITPSAARSIFEAILWKPSIRWQVTRLEILNPVRWISVRRNEIGSTISERSINQAMNASKGELGLYVEEERQQRAGLFFRDVRYRIYANLIFDQEKEPDSNYGKYSKMFERRAEKGQCFNQPYLGCREFSCHFQLIDSLVKEPPPISETRTLGWMLYDLDYRDSSNPMPRFFMHKCKMVW